MQEQVTHQQDGWPPGCVIMVDGASRPVVDLQPGAVAGDEMSFAMHQRPLRERGALVKQRADLAIQLPHTPVAAQGFRLIKIARLRLLHREQADVVRP